MFERIRENLVSGVEKVKWFASLLSERLRVEMAVVRLIGEAKALEKKKDEAARAVGERVYELRAQESADVFKDQRVKESLKEVERLASQIEAIKGKVSDISGPQQE